MRRKEFEVYTRWCKRCKTYFTTEFKKSKICVNCDKRVRKKRTLNVTTS